MPCPHAAVVGPLIAALALTGCSHAPSSHRAGASRTSAPAASYSPHAQVDVGRSCWLYLYGHDARIQVTTTHSSINPVPECGSLASSLSNGGDFWTTQTVNTEDATPAVCAMSKAPWSMVVRDGGTQTTGQQVCSGLLQQGWSEDSTAERQAQAQESASAQASAATSARAADQDAAVKAVDALNDDIAHFTNASAVRADATQADKDLAGERSDAKNGNGDGCYNVDNVVGYDAENNVGYDVNTSGSYDVQQETNGIQGMRSDISAVERAETALKADGLPMPAGASSALSQAQHDVTQAVATTNKAIDDMNADLKTAYQIANTLGTGDCAGKGPGATPAGLSHIS